MAKRYGKLRFAYHGTPNKATADRILRTGFPVGTFMANHLENAIGYGGPWVFTVVVPADFFTTAARGTDAWEATTPTRIGPSWIADLHYYKTTAKLHRQELWDEVAASNE